ncbi:SRPBCC family protein [Streptomyces sp. NRRL WC-3742]|uniref:SRPBCC family protein n=1 Tax=Streptomyces sp. NRRL WC-3742 TaxID=1463934 RepID=UPI00068D0789|nr:SRPBCC domain-containing protein [Streptomyces sp. NRRL WC-3742]
MTENLGELTITRELPAAPEAVFRAYVEPEQFVRFWGPVGTHVDLDTVTIEPRVGGRYDSTMTVDEGGQSFPVSMVITEFVPNELIALKEEAVGMRSTMTFKDLGDGRTELVLHQEDVPEMYRGPEAEAGLNSSFDRLVEYLSSLA